MPIIDLPDGNQLDIPDDAPPEVLSAVRTKLQGMGQFAAAQQTPKPAGFLESAGRDLMSGFGRSAATVARGAASAANLLLPADEEGQKTPGSMTAPTTNSLSRMLTGAADSAEDYWTKVGDKSTNNAWGQKALRGVGGAMTSAPTAVSAAAGAGSGIGDEVATRMSGGQDNPLLRFAGSLLGGTVAGTAAGLAGRARPQSADVAREAMEGISEPQLMAAQAYKNQQAAKGIDIDLAQALQATGGHGGNLESVRNFLAQRSQGDQVQKTLRAQPEQLAREAELTVGSAPGNNYSALQNANNVQETASERLKQAMGERSAAVKGLYAEAGDLPPNARSELGTILNKYATQAGATDVLRARATELAQKLLGNDPKLAAGVEEARTALAAAKSPSERMAAQQALGQANAAMQGAATKPLRALDVDTWIGELRGPWQGQPLKVAYPKEQGQVKGLAGELNRKFQELSPEVAKAEGVFKRITDETINPLKQGAVGQLSQPRGYDPGTQAMMSKFDGLMNKGTDPTAKVSDIATAVKELGKKDPAAFEDAFKGWLSRKVQAAVEPGVGDVALSQANPENLYANLFKDPLQWQGIKDAPAGMAKLRGDDPAEVIRGLENLRQLTTAMKSRPSQVGGVSPGDLKQLGGNSNVANAVRVMSFLPVNRLGEGIERAAFGKTLSQLDTILTSPEGAKMLIELGKVPVMSRKAQVILGTWGGGMGNPPGLQSDNTLD
jgi:hypothetical protein